MANSAFSVGGLSGGGGAYVYISSATAAASPSITFTGLTGAYDSYVILIDDVILATTTQILVAQMSTNNGSSYDSTALYSYQSLYGATSTAGAVSATGQTYLNLIAGTITNASYSSGTILIINPSGSQAYKNVITNIGTTTNNQLMSCMTTAYNNVAPVNAIKIFSTSGNITSGTFKLYGIAANNVGASSNAVGARVYARYYTNAGAATNVTSTGVSSITYNAAGNVTINFSSNFSSATSYTYTGMGVFDNGTNSPVILTVYPSAGGGTDPTASAITLAGLVSSASGGTGNTSLTSGFGFAAFGT